MPHHKELGKPTPCGGCENEPPALTPCLALIDRLYSAAFGARDGFGGFHWPVFTRLLDLEGFDADQHRFALEAIGAVEAVLAETRKEEAQRDREKAEREAKSKRLK